MANHSSIIAWRIRWSEEPGRLWSMELQKSWTRLMRPSMHTWTTAPQASLSFTVSRSLLKFISIELVRPLNHLILLASRNLSSQSQYVGNYVKAMTNLDSVLKNRDISLLTKVCIVKAMVFPVIVQECESWTTKKAEHQRTDAFELWCWSRLLRVPWTARKSNQSILKEINTEFIGRTDAEAEVPTLGPPDVKSQLTGKDPDAGKD